MDKFVKLENGNYINIDQIITISENGSSFFAYTTGFDNEWQAHSESLTKKDLDKIMKASVDHVELKADDLIELAKTGKTKNIELDEMGKVVFKNCLGVLDFEKDCYERYGC